MKIAITLYMIQNLGGIVNHLENCARGFIDLGHKVDFYILTPKKNPPKHSKTFVPRGKDGWAKGVFGPVHQYNGWKLKQNRYLSYYDADSAKRGAEVLSKYDLILWEMPCPRMNKENKGNSHWLHFYGTANKNVSVFRDGHLFRYPQIAAVLKYFDGFGCNHVCGYNIAKNISTPRALIFSPLDMTDGPLDMPEYRERKKGFLSLQTFKGWKHVDDLIRAIPYMPTDMKKYVAGGGIEYAYMTSKDKCKDKYFVSRKEDPNYKGKDRTERIWNRALDANMKWLGWIVEKKRDRILRSVRCLIDPSWNTVFAKEGDHFNRVTIDAMRQGCIPIARNFGVGNNKKGNGLIFNPKKNYIMIPHDASPKEFAERVIEANNLSNNKANKILEWNYKLIFYFHNPFVAQNYIDLANGNKKIGYLNDVKIGKTNSNLLIEAKKVMATFFGQQPKRKKGIANFL